MLGWRCIPESIINSSHDLKPFAVSVSLQQQDVTQHDNNEEHRITPKNGKSIYCGCYFFGKQKCRPFAVVGHVINVLKTRKQFAFRKFARPPKITRVCMGKTTLVTQSRLSGFPYKSLSIWKILNCR